MLMTGRSLSRDYARPRPAPAAPSPDDEVRRIVYLLGAGATHGSARFAGSTASLVMPGLIDRLLDRTNDEYVENFADHAGLKHLVNDVVSDETDFEHLLTFLQDTPSRRYQEFAGRLRTVFWAVLRRELEKVRREVGEQPSALYGVLLDMHEVAGLASASLGSSPSTTTIFSSTRSSTPWDARSTTACR